MDYVLMNKNKPLCRLSIDMENYVIDDILEVFNQKAFPVGVDFIGGKEPCKMVGGACYTGQPYRCGKF